MGDNTTCGGGAAVAASEKLVNIQNTSAASDIHECGSLTEEEKNKMERIYWDAKNQKPKLPPYYFVQGPHDADLLVCRMLQCNSTWLGILVFDDTSNTVYEWTKKTWSTSWRLPNMMPLDGYGRLVDGRVYMITHSKSPAYMLRTFPGAMQGGPDLLADTLVAYCRAYYAQQQSSSSSRKRKN